MPRAMPTVPGYFYDATRNRYYKLENHSKGLPPPSPSPSNATSKPSSASSYTARSGPKRRPRPSDLLHRLSLPRSQGGTSPALLAAGLLSRSTPRALTPNDHADFPPAALRGVWPRPPLSECDARVFPSGRRISSIYSPASWMSVHGTSVLAYGRGCSLVLRAGATMETVTTMREAVSAIALCKDGGIAVANENGLLSFGTILRMGQNRECRFAPQRRSKRRISDVVTLAWIKPRVVVSGERSGGLRVEDTRMRKGAVWDMKGAPVGKVVCGMDERKVYVTRLSKGRRGDYGKLEGWDLRMDVKWAACEFDGHVAGHRRVGFDVDDGGSGLVAAGGDDGVVRLWECRHGGAPVAEIEAGGQAARVELSGWGNGIGTSSAGLIVEKQNQALVYEARRQCAGR